MIDDDKMLIVSGESSEKPNKTNRRDKNSGAKHKENLIKDVMGGNVLSNDYFVRQFPFILYVVFICMLYITNVYIAEDMGRNIIRFETKVEDLHVEYVFYKSEITKATKQSELIKMLEKKGIKESVEPLKLIVVEKKGGE